MVWYSAPFLHSYGGGARPQSCWPQSRFSFIFSFDRSCHDLAQGQALGRMITSSFWKTTSFLKRRLSLMQISIIGRERIIFGLIQCLTPAVAMLSSNTRSKRQPYLFASYTNPLRTSTLSKLGRFAMAFSLKRTFASVRKARNGFLKAILTKRLRHGRNRWNGMKSFRHIGMA